MAQPLPNWPLVTRGLRTIGALPSIRCAVTIRPGSLARQSVSNSQPSRHHQNLLRVPLGETMPLQIPFSDSDVHNAFEPSQNRPVSFAGCGAGGTKAG